MRRMIQLAAGCAAAAAGAALAGDVTLSEAREVAREIKNQGGLADVIQAAERHCGGCAVAVSVFEGDVTALRNSAKSGRDAKRNEGDANTRDKTESRSTHAFRVTCLINDAQLRDVVVCGDGEVIGTRLANQGMSRDAYPRNRYDQRDSRYTSAYGNRDDFSDYDRRRVNSGYIEQDAWPPSPGDDHYREYRNAENDRTIDRYDGRYDDQGRYSRYNRNDRFDSLHDNDYRPREILFASELMNTRADNMRGERLGYIDDVAVDLGNGEVLYTVLATDGFLGIGAKRFAIPCAEIRPAGDRVRIDAQKQEIERREGFDSDQWPQRANPYWSSSAEYRQSGASQPVQSWAKASDVIGCEVSNSQGETLGEVDDIVVDHTSGQVTYLLMEPSDRSGFIPVPIEACRAKSEDEITLNVPRESLASMATFENKQQPSWTSERWNRNQRAAFSVSQQTRQPGQTQLSSDVDNR